MAKKINAAVKFMQTYREFFNWLLTILTALVVLWQQVNCF